MFKIDSMSKKKFTLRSGNSPLFKQMGSSPNKLNSFGFARGTSPITQKVDWSTAPAVGSQERTEWYKKHNLKLDDTTPKPNTNDQVVTTDNKGNIVEDNNNQTNQTTEPDNTTDSTTDTNDAADTSKPKKGKAAKNIINTLIAGVTSGLDAVYGTGKVIPKGINFQQNKKKKDDVEQKSTAQRILEDDPSYGDITSKTLNT